MKTITIKTLKCSCGLRIPYDINLAKDYCPLCKKYKLEEVKDPKEMLIVNIAEDEEIRKEIEMIKNNPVKNDLIDLSTPQKEEAYFQKRKEEIMKVLIGAKKLKYKKSIMVK